MRAPLAATPRHAAGTPLPRSFFARGAEDVAPALLGTDLCHATAAGVQRARIVETEAYVGEHDLACHASRGRKARTDVMYGPPGHAYVYFVYGMHDMLNVVCAPAGDPQAVLVRAVEPVAHVGGRTDGPARLTKALGVKVATHNGMDLRGPTLWIEAGRAPRRIERAPRVGVEYAGSWAARPLRFLDAGSAHVSQPAHGTKLPGRRRPA